MRDLDLTLSGRSSVLAISSFGMESKARMEAVPFCLLLVPTHGFELRYLTECGITLWILKPIC